MSEIHGNITIALNGSSAFTVGNDTYTWSGSNLFFVDVWSPDVGSNYVATVNLTGSNWNAGLLQFNSLGTLKTVVNDSINGSNRFIEHMLFHDEGGVTLTLKSTSVRAITGGMGDDVVTLGTGFHRTVDLFDGNNTLKTGTQFLAFAAMGSGTDTIEVGVGGAGSLELGSGTNTLKSTTGFVQSAFGYEGNDTFTIGAGGAGSLRLGSGTNKVVATGYVDTIYAYEGVDTITIGSSGAGLINLGDGTNTVKATGLIDAIVTGKDDDVVDLTDVGSINLRQGNNTINVSGYADSIVTYDNDDTVTVGKGARLVALGKGNDNLTLGSDYVDAVTMGQGNDTVNVGTFGVRDLSLGAGDDTAILQGLSDPAEFIRLSGGDGVDTLSFAKFTANLSVSLVNGGVVTSAGEFAYGGGFENLSGGTANDTLTGNDGANVLFGGLGNDILVGGNGADQLSGSSGVDTASYAGAAAGVIVNLLDPTKNTASAQGDTYTSIESITGSSFNDTLVGNSGNNRLAAGTGVDILTGGDGLDSFRFNSALNASTNSDKITDFKAADDTIELSSAIFQTLAVGALASSAFRANTTGLAADADDRIIYNTTNGGLYYDADGSGAAARTLFGVLTDKAAITAADFLIF
ncbi:calcium-binding protein [Mesorhizobium sp. CN2-181]|uniref:calcium-binding protein n=1 Tax=Mesorhizobium yinganensis TaxID=3157707 RepID=UPI0032B7FB10